MKCLHLLSTKMWSLLPVHPGIGRELAYQLADQGAWLSLAARNLEQLEQVAQTCSQRGGRALAIPTDVSQQSQCKNLIDQTVAEFGRIDTLVNNAGITMWALFDQIQDLSILEQIMQINYFGSLYCTHYALPYLKETRGRLVAISSVTGKAGVPTRSGYAASKDAMVGFFDSLRVELSGTGVTVTISYPDFVATEIRERAFEADGKPLGTSPVQEGIVMSAKTCARMIVQAMEKRHREDVQTLRAKLGQWIKLIAPGMVDKITAQAIRRGK